MMYSYRNLSNITTSFKNSSFKSSEFSVSFIIFIATLLLWKLPKYINLKVPYPILFSSSNSTVYILNNNFLFASNSNIIMLSFSSLFNFLLINIKSFSTSHVQCNTKNISNSYTYPLFKVIILKFVLSVYLYVPCLTVNYTFVVTLVTFLQYTLTLCIKFLLLTFTFHSFLLSLCSMLYLYFIE